MTNCITKEIIEALSLVRQNDNTLNKMSEALTRIFEISRTDCETPEFITWSLLIDAEFFNVAASSIANVLTWQSLTNYHVYRACQNVLFSVTKEYPVVWVGSQTEYDVLHQNAIQKHMMSHDTSLQTSKTKPSGWIYCFREQGRRNVKFGYSSDLQRRLNSAQTNNGDKLSIVGYIAGTLEQEKRLHCKLRGKLRGNLATFPGHEWYKLSDPRVLRVFDFFDNITDESDLESLIISIG